jgi:aconitate hydratase 2 / 2-methylisocitrate dehydratase
MLRQASKFSHSLRLVSSRSTISNFRFASSFKTDYDGAAAERAKMGIVPKPLNAEETSKLVELLKSPPKGEEAFLMDLLTNRISPGVDEAAYVKAAFLSAVVKGEAKSELVPPALATELLSTMQGGYNIATLVDLLDHPELAEKAADGLSNTILMFEAFHDVEVKAKKGNKAAERVMKSWANAEWFLKRPAVPEKITVTVFKVSSRKGGGGAGIFSFAILTQYKSLKQFL